MKKYCRKYSPCFSKKYRRCPMTGKLRRTVCFFWVMSWMKTITRNANRANPIRLPRPYEITPSMPDSLLSCRSQSASDDRRSGAASQNLRQDAEDHRLRIVGRAALDLGLGGRAHVDHGAGKLERHAGKRMVGVEHYFVFGDVGDGEDQIFLVAARCALEAHSDLEGLGKAAARLDSEKVFVVVAEGVLGLQAHFDAILGSLALEGGLGRRKYVSVAAVQILQGLLGALDEFAPDVGQLDVERNDRVFRDVQALGSGSGPANAAT